MLPRPWLIRALRHPLLSHPFFILVLLLLLVGRASAQSAAVAIEVHPLLQAAIGLLCAVMTACLPMLVSTAARRVGVQLDAATQQTLATAVQRGAGAVYNHLVANAQSAANPTIKSAAMAKGVQFVLDSAPAALAASGWSADKIAAEVAAELGKLLAADPTVSPGESAALPVRTPAVLLGIGQPAAA